MSNSASDLAPTGTDTSSNRVPGNIHSRSNFGKPGPSHSAAIVSPTAANEDGPNSATPVDLSGPPAAIRHRLPSERMALTHHFSIAGHEGYMTIGLYPSGQPGELFLRMAKEGSTIAGLMECFGIAVSVGLQHGVPLKVLCEKFAHTRFEPSGWTGNEQMGYAKSIMDYIFRWIESRFLAVSELAPVDQASVQPPEPSSDEAPAVQSTGYPPIYQTSDAPLCQTCGAIMSRSGTCFRCGECGGTSGCS
jgi:ribonucleoside-diphosphate reductase alpha chain